MSFYNETYFEFDEAFDDPWTRVPNSILDDERISAKAIGIYSKIVRFQNSKKHKIYISSLTKQLKDGKSSVSSGIKELVKFGYISREQIRNEKGQLIGCKYKVYPTPRIDVNNDESIENTTFQRKKDNVNDINYVKNDVNYVSDNDESIENTTFQPKSEKRISEKLISENTSHKKKIEKKENRKKENKVVVVDDAQEVQEIKFESLDANEKLVKENMIIEIYKTYKLQARVMPQMKKLLLAYADKMDLELYEEIFMLASEDNIKSKYRFIKELLEKFDKKSIYTLESYRMDCQKFKEGKQVNSSKDKSKASKNKKNGSQVPKVVTRFHNINQRIDNYTKEELEETILVSQSVKFGDNNLRTLYLRAIDNGLNSLHTEAGKIAVVKYAEKRKLEIPS